MKKKLSIVLLFLIMLLLLSPDRSFAVVIRVPGLSGDGGGGKSEPKYYSFEDLRGHLRDKEKFYFQNADKPANALISLGYLLSYPACAPSNAKTISSFRIAPIMYRIDYSHICCNWRDDQKSTFDWKQYRNDLIIGDLIFTRGDDKMNNLSKFFSNWTHVVIVSDPNNNRIFDSTLDYGVRNHSVPDKWEGFGYYTCKRVIMPISLKDFIVKDGIQKYSDIPYLPKLGVSDVLLFNFVYKWCDKDDKSSMYCSKLVYNVFKPFININTRRTSVDCNSMLKDKALGDYLFSWIGVSPDNIYYSPSLGPDFDYSYNIRDLI